MDLLDIAVRVLRVELGLDDRQVLGLDRDEEHDAPTDVRDRESDRRAEGVHRRDCLLHEDRPALK